MDTSTIIPIPPIEIEAAPVAPVAPVTCAALGCLAPMVPACSQTYNKNFGGLCKTCCDYYSEHKGLHCISLDEEIKAAPPPPWKD